MLTPHTITNRERVWVHSCASLKLEALVCLTNKEQGQGGVASVVRMWFYLLQAESTTRPTTNSTPHAQLLLLRVEIQDANTNFQHVYDCCPIQHLNMFIARCSLHHAPETAKYLLPSTIYVCCVYRCASSMNLLS